MAGLAGTVGASVLGRPKTALGAATSTPAPTARVTGSPASPSVPATAGSSPTPTAASGSGATSAPASGPLVARVNQLTSGRAVTFDDPVTGDPGVILKLADGSFVAFDAVCTHAGCIVEYDRGSGFLLCPCHGAAFDPRNDAQAVAGPTNQPLSPIPIHVDTASGRITLTG